MKGSSWLGIMSPPLLLLAPGEATIERAGLGPCDTVPLELRRDSGSSGVGASLIWRLRHGIGHLSAGAGWSPSEGCSARLWLNRGSSGEGASIWRLRHGQGLSLARAGARLPRGKH